MSGAPDARPDDVTLVARAADFAVHRHTWRRRITAGRTPRIDHLANVALLLAETAGRNDARLVAAGWLHDVREDTLTTKDELEQQFGSVIAGIVAEVTYDKLWEDNVRRGMQLERVATRSEAARLLTIAEKASNLGMLASHPPRDWDAARIASYIAWAREVVASCRGLNAALDEIFDAAAAAAAAKVLALDPQFDSTAPSSR